MSTIWLNNRLIPAEEALVSVQDRGFRYGDGVFETIAVHAGVPYQFDWHMQRLEAGLAALKINYKMAGLQGACKELLKANHLQNAMLRLQITRGIGSHGYLPAPSTQPCVIIETLPLPPISTEPVRLWLSSLEKISPRALPAHIKHCQGLNSALARLEAEENHCFDALLLNAEANIAETSSASIFWLKENQIYTPALVCGILEGSTRAALLRLASAPVQEIVADISALKAADAVCITNAAWQVLPVAALKPLDFLWKSLPFAERLNALLAADIAAYTQDCRAQWL